MNYGKKHDLPFGIMDVAGLLRLNIRRRAPGQVYVDCPICGDRRGKMNLNTAKDLWRCNYCGEGGGMLSLYAKVYGVSNSDAYREICDALAVNGFSPDYTVPEKAAPAEAEQSDAASIQEVHQTLSMLLSMLTLIPAHHTHLQSVRGLSDDEITRFGFNSTPPPFLCRSLTNRLVKAGCRVQGVPGFYVDDNGCWTVKFHQRTSGIIIPIFGVDGLIHGAQIRLDHPLKDKDDPPEKTGVKYLTLSSTGKRMGTTSGSPIHFVGDPCSRVVYVTEGCLKADVAHALMHRTFVATLGVNNTAKLDELFAFLHRNGTEEIIEAEDMDKYSNEMVGKGASKIYALAARHGMRCRRLTWNPNYKLSAFIACIIDSIPDDQCYIVRYDDCWTANDSVMPDLHIALEHNNISNINKAIVGKKCSKLVSIFVKSCLRYNSFIQIVFPRSQVIISPSDHLDVFIAYHSDAMGISLKQLLQKETYNMLQASPSIF